jgi:MOSC domain-containing protein YiiM
MDTMAGRLESVNRSGGGVPKTGVFEALITEDGLEGDRQASVPPHGGADRAIVLFSLDVIRALQREGHPITAGSTGENLTVSGLDWPALRPGHRIQVGPVLLLLTRHASPCRKIAGSFLERDFSRIDQNDHPGWSRFCARVLEAGIVSPGDPVSIVG